MSLTGKWLFLYAFKDCDQTRKQLEHLVRKIDDLYDVRKKLQIRID